MSRVVREECPVCKTQQIMLSGGVMRAHDGPWKQGGRGRCDGSGHPPDPTLVAMRKLKFQWRQLREEVCGAEGRLTLAVQGVTSAEQRLAVAMADSTKAHDDLTLFEQDHPELMEPSGS